MLCVNRVLLYPASRGFFLAWLLAFTKSFASLVSRLWPHKEGLYQLVVYHLKWASRSAVHSLCNVNSNKNSMLPFTWQTSSFLLKNGCKSLKLALIKAKGFSQMEHEFLFGTFRQDYHFRCSVAPGIETLHWNDMKSRIPFLPFQPDFSQTFSKW